MSQEASVYRLLKAQDLITSPAYIVIKAAQEFKDKTTGSLTSSGRLHLSRRSRAGADALSLKRARRLLAVHCRLEAMYDHDGAGRHATLDLALEASGLDE